MQAYASNSQGTGPAQPGFPWAQTPTPTTLSGQRDSSPKAQTVVLHVNTTVSGTCVSGVNMYGKPVKFV